MINILGHLRVYNFILSVFIFLLRNSVNYNRPINIVSKKTNNQSQTIKPTLNPLGLSLDPLYVTIILAYTQGEKVFYVKRENILFSFYGCFIARVLRYMFKTNSFRNISPFTEKFN